MLALAYGGYSPVKAEGKNYSDYVNPLMGTLSELGNELLDASDWKNG